MLPGMPMLPMLPFAPMLPMMRPMPPMLPVRPARPTDEKLSPTFPAEGGDMGNMFENFLALFFMSPGATGMGLPLIPGMPMMSGLPGMAVRRMDGHFGPHHDSQVHAARTRCCSYGTHPSLGPLRSAHTARPTRPTGASARDGGCRVDHQSALAHPTELGAPQLPSGHAPQVWLFLHVSASRVDDEWLLRADLHLDTCFAFV